MNLLFMHMRKINKILFTAVVMSELVKLITCLGLVYIDERSVTNFIYALKATIIDEPLDTLKVCVPSLLYIIQNNLLYVSASNLDAATHQVTVIFFFIIILSLILKMYLKF